MLQLRRELETQSVDRQEGGRPRPSEIRVSKGRGNNAVAHPRKRTTPIFRSTVAMRLFAPGFNSLLETSFSRASTTPSLHRIPIAVPPFSTALTAYSTWKLRPSGEKTEFVRS